MSVYFISSGDFIKIGVSDNPFSRLRTLQTANPSPLKLLAIIPVGNELETELHTRLSDYRAGGEWFRNEGDVAELVAIMSKLFPPNVAHEPTIAVRPEPKSAAAMPDSWFMATADEIQKRIEIFAKLTGRSIYFKDKERRILLGIPGAIYDPSASGPSVIYYPDGNGIATPKVGREIHPRNVNDRLHEVILYALWNVRASVSQKEGYGVIVVIEKAVQP